MTISISRIKQLAGALPPGMQGLVRQLTKPLWRRWIAMQYYSDKLALISRWAWKDTETSNFYYKLTAFNRDHLAQLISSLTGKDYDAVIAYFEELESDSELRAHLEDALRGTTYGKDIEIEYGRRIGWYGLVRVLKPKVIVETGVDHGVGSCVLASALIRNTAEGYPGKYYGTEIRTQAGQLFRGKYSAMGQILYNDSIVSLKQLDEQIDIFVNDSDHSGEYEYQEYQTIVSKLSDTGLILGDNSHATDSLSRFSREQGRGFIFFSEHPSNHWYPGAGIGVSYKQQGLSPIPAIC